MMHQTLLLIPSLRELFSYEGNSLTQPQVQTYNPNTFPEGKMQRCSKRSSFVSADILEEATSHLSTASLASQQAATTHGGPRTMEQNPRISEAGKPSGIIKSNLWLIPALSPNHSIWCHIRVRTWGRTGAEQISCRGTHAVRSWTHLNSSFYVPDWPAWTTSPSQHKPFQAELWDVTVCSQHTTPLAGSPWTTTVYLSMS